MRETPAQLASPDLGSPRKVWKILCDNDDSIERSAEIFAQHPNINQRMRAVLLEWIMDVCHDQKLHRETYHLAVDYIDRFLLRADESFKPHQLQLVGSTALVIAMKMEEIYPPKVSTIADLTDGTCTESQIRDMETCMLVKLDWQCTPVTAIHWLGLYLQLMSTVESSDATLNPQHLLKKRHDLHHNHVVASPTSSRGRSSNCTSNSSASRRSKGDHNLEAEDDEEAFEDLYDNKENLIHLPYHHDYHGEKNGYADNGKEKADDEHDEENLCDDCLDGSDDQLSSAEVLELSYFAGQTSTLNVSDHHFYPDQRCTVSKLMRDEFVRLATVLDMMILDAGSLRFKYSELAAAIIWHSYEPENMVQGITGFRHDEMEDVLEFSKPFVMHYERIESTGVLMPCHADISSDDAHNIQSYVPEAVKQLVLSDENISKLSTSPKICNNISDSTSTTAAGAVATSHQTSAHAAAAATPTATTTSTNNVPKASHNNNYVHPLPQHRQQQYHQVAPRKRKFDQQQQQQQPKFEACSSILVDSSIKPITTTTSNNTNSNPTASHSVNAQRSPCSTAPSTSANSVVVKQINSSSSAVVAVASHSSPPPPASVTPPAAASTLTESADARKGDTLTVVKSEKPAAAKIAKSASDADQPSPSHHCDSSRPSDEPQASIAVATGASPSLASQEQQNQRPLHISVILSKVSARKLRQLAFSNPRILRKLGIKTLKLVSSDGSADEPIHLPHRPPPSPIPVPLAVQLSGVGSQSGRSANGDHLHPHNPHPHNSVLVSPLHFAQQQRSATGLSKIISAPQQPVPPSPYPQTMEQHQGAANVAQQQYQHMLQQQQFQQHQQRMAGGMAPSPMYGGMQAPMPGQQPPSMAAGPPQQMMRQNSALAAQQQQRMMGGAGAGSNGSVPGTPLSATPIPSQQQRRSIDAPGTPQQMKMQMNSAQRQNAFPTGTPMGMPSQHGGMMVDQQQAAGQTPHGYHSQPGTSQNMADASLLVNLLSNNGGPQHHGGMMAGGQPPMMTPEQQHATAMQQRYSGHGQSAGAAMGMTSGQQQLYQSQMLQQQQHMLAQQQQGGSAGGGAMPPMGGMMSQQQYIQHQQQMMLHQQQMQQQRADGVMMMGGGPPGGQPVPGMPMMPQSQFAPGAMPPAANAALQQQPPPTADNGENPPSKKRKRQTKKAQKEEQMRLQQEQQQQQLHQQQLQQQQKQQQQFAMQQMQHQIGGNPQEYYIMHHQQQRVPSMNMHIAGGPQMPGQQYQQRMTSYPVQFNGYSGQPPPQTQQPNAPSTPGAMNPMMNPHFPGAYNASGMHASLPPTQQQQLWQQQSAAAAAAAQQQADFQQQQAQMRMTPQHHQPSQVGTPCNFYVHSSSSQSPMDMKQQIPPPPSYGESNSATTVNQRGTPHSNMGGFMSPPHQHSASPVFAAGGSGSGQQPAGIGHGQQPSRASTGSNMGTPSTPQQQQMSGGSAGQIFSQLTDYADAVDDLNAITCDAEDFDLDSIEPMRTDNSGSNDSPSQSQQQSNGQSAAHAHQQQQQMLMQQQMGQQVSFQPEYAGSSAQQQQQNQFIQQQQHMNMLRQQQHQNAIAQQQQQQRQQQQHLSGQPSDACNSVQPAPPPQKRQRQGGGAKSSANGQPPSAKSARRESADTLPSTDESAVIKEEEADLESKFFAQRSPQNSDEPSSPSKISELQQENITNSIQSVMERVLGNNGNSNASGSAGTASAQPTKGVGSQKGRGKAGGGPKAEKKLVNGEGGSRAGKRPHSIVLPRTASTSDASSLSASPSTAPPSESVLSVQPSRSRTPTFSSSGGNAAYIGFNGHNAGEHSPKISPTAVGEKSTVASSGDKQPKTICKLPFSADTKAGGNKPPPWQRAAGSMESPPAVASSSCSSAVVTPSSGGCGPNNNGCIGSQGTASTFSSSCSSSASSTSSALTDHYANFNGHISSEAFATKVEATSISSIAFKATTTTIVMSAATKISAKTPSNDNDAFEEPLSQKDAPADFDAQRSPSSTDATTSPPVSGAIKNNALKSVVASGEPSAEILEASKA